MDTLTDRELTWFGLASASMPGTVRLLLEQRLALLGAQHALPAGMAEDLYLAASELVTAACTATPDAGVVFNARFDARSIRLGVWDESPDVPRAAVLADWARYALIPDLYGLEQDRVTSGLNGWRLALVMRLSPNQWIEWIPPHGKWVCIAFDF